MITDKRLLRAEPSFRVLAKLWRVSWLYVLLICVLAGVGYGALYSAGGGSARPFAGPQSLRFGFGLLMMLGVAMVGPRLLVRLAWPLYALSLLLLAAVLRMGHVGKGAERWLVLGGVQLQPSELAKIALALALAAWFHRIGQNRMGNPLFLVPPALMVAAPVALVLKEPNPRHRGDHRGRGGGDLSRRRDAVVAAGGAAGAAAVPGPHRLCPPP